MFIYSLLTIGLTSVAYAQTSGLIQLSGGSGFLAPADRDLWVDLIFRLRRQRLDDELTFCIFFTYPVSAVSWATMVDTSLLRLLRSQEIVATRLQIIRTLWSPTEESCRLQVLCIAQSRVDRLPQATISITETLDHLLTETTKQTVSSRLIVPESSQLGRS